MTNKAVVTIIYVKKTASTPPVAVPAKGGWHTTMNRINWPLRRLQMTGQPCVADSTIGKTEREVAFIAMPV
jgi:hypothetical protein